MGDEYFWVGIFMLQGMVADILLIFGIVFILLMWVKYKVQEQKQQRAESNERREFRETIEEQVDALLQELEG